MTKKGDYEVLDLRHFVVTPGMFHVIEMENVQTENDLQRLIQLLFLYPERDVYYFQEDGKRNVLINKAADRGDILMYEFESFHYKNPKFIRHYEHIPEGSVRYDWQKDIIAQSPMFVRSRLKLSERKKRELETWEKIQLEEVYRKHKKTAENYRDVFLSYASVDRHEANIIFEAINNAGGRVFLAEKSLNPGEDFADKIREALCASRELWLIVSPNSLRSEWVLTELGAAWALDKKIVPILHRCSPENLPQRLRGLHCIDFYKYTELIESTFRKS